MQSKNQNDSVQLSTRYQQYDFAKRHLRGTSRPEVFPLGQEDGETSNLRGQQTNTLTARYEGAQATGSYVIEGEQHAQKVRVKEATKKGYATATEGDSINLSVPNSKTRRGRVGHGVAQTLDTGMQQYTLQNSRIRRLTPIECERLQGFPDHFTKYGVDDQGQEVLISDTQRYKVFGNAVTTNVIKDIVCQLLK